MRASLGASLAFALIGALAPAGCGGGDSSPNTPQGGDSGTGGDTGTTPGDSGSPQDSSMRADTETPTDSGSMPTDSSNAVDSGGGETGGGDGGVGYMMMCTMPGGQGDCQAGLICFNFPTKGDWCTHACTTNGDCMPPSTGCNGMGVCKAP